MFEKQIKIPEPEEIKAELPLPKELESLKKSRDKAVE